MTTLNPLNSDDVLLKDAGVLIEQALMPNTPLWVRPMLKRQADERLQLIFHRTEGKDTREAVRLLRIALRAIK